MNDTGKILVAFAAGAAVGAALGILFAPDKGSATRHKISEQGKKLAGVVKEKFREGKEKFEEMKDGFGKTAKEKMEEFI